MKVRKTDRPILFRADMVRALLAGRKTQTRRILKVNTQCPYGVVGDTLWVKETYFVDGDDTLYRADYDDAVIRKWKPSLFMPRDKSRIELRITDIRIERLCDISEADAIAEGVEEIDGMYKNYYTTSHNRNFSHMLTRFYFGNPITSFLLLWDSINGEDSVDANEYVWVITFERMSRMAVLDNIKKTKLYV